MKILKQLSKLFVKKSLIENIEEEILNNKDISNIAENIMLETNIDYIKNLKQDLKKVKENKNLISKFTNLVIRLNKNKILNLTNQNLKNYYLSYFSLYILLFIIIYVQNDEKEKKEILDFFITKWKITIPDNFKLPKNISKNLEILFDLKLNGKEISFYLILIDFFTQNGILEKFFSYNISLKIINKGIITTTNKKFLNFLLKNNNFNNIDNYLDLLLDLGTSNKLINTKLSRLYTEKLIDIFFYNITKYNLYSIDNLIKDFNKINFINKYYTPLYLLEYTKFNNKLKKFNKEMLEKEINSLKSEIKTLEYNKGINLEKTKEISKLKTKIQKLKNSGIFNYDYYFFINLIIGTSKENIINLFENITNKNLYKNFVNIYVKNIEDELLQNFEPSNKKLIPYYNYLLFLYLTQNKEKSYKEIFQKFDNKKEIITYLFFKGWKYINEDKLLEELIKETNCLNCSKLAVSLYNLKDLLNYQLSFIKKIPKKNWIYIKKIFNSEQNHQLF